MTTVLIADNDRAVSRLLTEVLERAGLQTIHAFDGEEALRLLREPGLRVFVCDLDMPRASGLEVLESLSDRPQPPQTVVVTGFLDASVEERLRALPFVHSILRKPFDLLRFAEAVRSLAGSDVETLDRGASA